MTDLNTAMMRDVFKWISKELDVYLDDPDSDFTVTHWMSLPEPPKEAEPQ